MADVVGIITTLEATWSAAAGPAAISPASNLAGHAFRAIQSWMGWPRTVLILLSAALLLCVAQACAGLLTAPPLVAAAGEGSPTDGDFEEERDSQERESEEQDSDEDENLAGPGQDFGVQSGRFALGDWADAEIALTAAHARGVFRPPQRARA